jgi:CheY-like chemotaxis protein
MRILARLKEWLSRTPASAGDEYARQIATVVHELRTPLNGILGMTYLLGQTKLTPEQQNYLSGIRQSGHALAQLVEDLLDYSTIQAGRFRLNNRAANLRQLIESVVEMLAPRAHEKGIEIAATVAADLPELLDLDPARLRQVLFNVVGNGIKFTQQGGVLVRAYVENGDVVIAVADTGPGMTTEAQARIFQEFEQVGGAVERSGGTGLGLSIASRILIEFGGSLSVTSAAGEGSTFTIRFPLHFAEDAPAGTNERHRLLMNSCVMLLAPQGPAARATVATIETLGGRCDHVHDVAEAASLLSNGARDSIPYTDVIVDHRMAASSMSELGGPALHRILLVNPEERASQPQDLYDAWLIRPLREKSLIDVLTGRMRGFGRRDRIAITQQEDKPAAALEILMAEDDPVSALMTSVALRKSGHRVMMVDNATDLLEAALVTTGRPDVIVTDLHMPGRAVPDALSALRSFEITQGLSPVPVILLTGAVVTAEIDAEALQIAHILEKPVPPGRLMQAVQQAAVGEDLR